MYLHSYILCYFHIYPFQKGDIRFSDSASMTLVLLADNVFCKRCLPTKLDHLPWFIPSNRLIFQTAATKFPTLHAWYDGFLALAFSSCHNPFREVCLASKCHHYGCTSTQGIDKCSKRVRGRKRLRSLKRLRLNTLMSVIGLKSKQWISLTLGSPPARS